jgi:hypothetical protein
MPEAGAQGSRAAASLQTLAQTPPVLPVRGAQISCRRSLHAGRSGGEQPDRAAQNRTRGRCLAAGGTPLVIALRAEELFKIVVGSSGLSRRAFCYPALLV